MTAARKTKNKGSLAAKKPLTKNRKAETRLSPAQLMATPKHMLAWLRSQPPRAVAAQDIISNTQCLASNFLYASGYARTAFGNDFHNLMPLGGWLGRSLNLLDGDRPVTAKRAITAITKAAGRRFQ